MELEGVVQNGLIVPDDATGLPDGTRVRIRTQTPAPPDAVAMLSRWAAEDDEMSDAEAAENADVLRAIDTARPSYRKLFTDVLSGDGR